MMGTTAMKIESTEVIRPLNILIPLIKEETKLAKEAADKAAMPHWLEVGLMLAEAKPQVDSGKFEAWIDRNFDFGTQHAQKCMRLARSTISNQKPGARLPETWSDAMRDSGEKPRGAERGGAAWHGPVKEAIEKASHIRYLHDESLKRAEERELERKLAAQLIDIGFKALAAKLHPDKGGSREAMARLNKVRDYLKKFI